MDTVVEGAVSRLLSSRWAAVAWTLLIIALCLLPGNEIPEVDVIGIDKVVHFLMFAVFSLLWWRQAGTRPTMRLIGFGLLLAIGTELGQGALNWGRIADPFDAVANAAGLAAGITAARTWLK